jgi:formamidopyrimidine-DNA glycosylase
VPELPDIAVYVERIAAIWLGQPLRGIRFGTPFVLRTVDPAATAFAGTALRSVDRIGGKRIAMGFDGDLYAVIHLMIAGRLHHRPAGKPLDRRYGIAAFDFEGHSLVLTEASKKRRAAIHLVRGATGLDPFDRGGIEPLTCSLADFATAMRRESRTVKRALTDPRIIAGIGNAYSDEILHRARLSPMRRTRDLDDADLSRLHDAVRTVLVEWTDTLRAESASSFPEHVTAFRPGMAVHGRYGEPCPVCAAPVQRIRYADNECNYCARCQNADRLLADRSLSRLLRDDWPRDLAELEEMPR